LRAVLEALDVSDVRMEEGSLRVDANISTRLVGAPEYGAKVEVKNMNSVRSVGKALEYEEKRQRDALEAGETLIQETRHFDEKTGATSSLRTKEFAFDYRYFPEPDMVPFEPDAGWIEQVKGSLPEMPADRRVRFVRDFGLPEKDVETLTATSATARWFEDAVAAYGGEAKKVANWILADLYGLLNEAGIELEDSKVQPAQLASLVKLIDEGTISGKQAKEVIAVMFETGSDPAAIVDERGLRQESDTSALEGFVDEVIAENADAVAKIKDGKEGTLGFLVGQVMKKSRGQANPGIVNDLLRSKILG
jgi:aspartyl-tRNA(Asn)/glutamyl-tRNA(Gln) amidotransferase subunit B